MNATDELNDGHFHYTSGAGQGVGVTVTQVTSSPICLYIPLWLTVI